MPTVPIGARQGNRTRTITAPCRRIVSAGAGDITFTGAVNGVAPVSSTVDTAIGTVEGVTGLNVQPVTNLVAGL